MGAIILERPERLNALSDAVVAALGAALDRVESDPEVRALLVTGSGRAFCAGADIAEFSTLEGPVEFRAFLSRLGGVLDRLADCPKPSVAALHGVAFGGGLELALACDIRVADETARLGVPEIKLGLLPGAAGTVRLPRRVPLPVAQRMLLTGDPLTAVEAHTYGLVAEVVPPGQVLEAAGAMAGKLAGLAPLALAAAKRLLASTPGMPEPAALDLERETVAMLFATGDRKEGVSAFLEKRSPRFTGG